MGTISVSHDLRIFNLIHPSQLMFWRLIPFIYAGTLDNMPATLYSKPRPEAGNPLSVTEELRLDPRFAPAICLG